MKIAFCSQLDNRMRWRKFKCSCSYLKNEPPFYCINSIGFALALYFSIFLSYSNMKSGYDIIVVFLFSFPECQLRSRDWRFDIIPNSILHPVSILVCQLWKQISDCMAENDDSFVCNFNKAFCQNPCTYLELYHFSHCLVVF